VNAAVIKTGSAAGGAAGAAGGNVHGRLVKTAQAPPPTTPRLGH